jgi:hypothetical protein
MLDVRLCVVCHAGFNPTMREGYRLGEACVTVYVLRLTSTKFGRHAGCWCTNIPTDGREKDLCVEVVSSE